MKRILTALVAIPILLYTVWSSSPYYFAGLAAIATLLALSEFYSLAAKTGCQPNNLVGYVTALGVLGSFLFHRPGWTVATVAVAVLASLALSLLQPDEMKTAVASVSATVFGLVYVAVLVGFLVAVRAIPDVTGARVPRLAPKLLTLFFALVMMTDTGAYYVGRALGRHKLAPRISPGKTVEGSIGGFITAIAVGPLCKLIFFPEIPIWQAMLLGAAIGIVSQVGDLAESLLKRGSDVKDSSTLLPGHGGMLDRLDSILFCAPLLYLFWRVVFRD
ncbi:MAG TPA: phosphatidate cytidylyltransferase [Blastocatellia bacterium]|nr:phosphatidate cytidylyltransferase [Blastocatellia bacterium]